MQSHQLKRAYPNMKRVIVARGGKRGKTSGRGGKGQSARAGNKRRPEWRDIIKKLPKLRGRGVNSHKGFQERPVVLNLSVLEAIFSANDAINHKTLLAKSVISTKSGAIPLVKILGDGEITKAFKISGCTISGSAKEKIEKAGGTVELTKAAIAAASNLAKSNATNVENKSKMNKSVEAAKNEKPKAEKGAKASTKSAAPKAAAPKTVKTPAKATK